MISWCGASFRGLVGHLLLFFGDMSVQVKPFIHLQTRLFVFLLSSCRNSFYVSDVSPVSDVISKPHLPFCVLLLHQAGHFLMRKKRCAVSLKVLPEQLKLNRTHQKGCICPFFLLFTVTALGVPRPPGLPSLDAGEH